MLKMLETHELEKNEDILLYAYYSKNMVLAWLCAHRWWYLRDESWPTERCQIMESIQCLHGWYHQSRSYRKAQNHTSLSWGYCWNETVTVRKFQNKFAWEYSLAITYNVLESLRKDQSNLNPSMHYMVFPKAQSHQEASAVKTCLDCCHKIHATGP